MILEQTAARQTKLLSLLRRGFGLSAGLVKRLKWQNALFVNGAPAHTDAPVTPGDRVRVVLEERTEGFDPEPLPLSILYEDECFLAVDKSSGMLVHPSPQKNSGTLANGVLYHLLERGEAGLPGADLVLLLRGEHGLRRARHIGKVRRTHAFLVFHTQDALFDHIAQGGVARARHVGQLLLAHPDAVRERGHDVLPRGAAPHPAHRFIGLHVEREHFFGLVAGLLHGVAVVDEDALAREPVSYTHLTLPTNSRV